MAVLAAGRRALARRLLAWDRARIAEVEGVDVSAYKQQQDLAETFIDVNVNIWPIEVRYYFMVLLEVTRTAWPDVIVGSPRLLVPRLTLAERILYRALALDIGVLGNLREVSSRQWADDDGEGD